MTFPDDRRPDHAAAVARARKLGTVAAWTGHCGAAIELSRLAGPHDAALRPAVAALLDLPSRVSWHLSDPGVRAALYSWMLTHGTQFDVYCWVNLVDLAAVWPEMDLSAGVRCEWEAVLQAAGLLASPP